MAGTVLAGIGGQFFAGWLEERRAKRDRRATRLDETRTVLEDATSAFVEAQLALDGALFRPGDHKLDSDALYGPLAKHQSRIALRLGGTHAIAEAFTSAVEQWARALNLAAKDHQAHEAEILAARSESMEHNKRFLDLAARLVGPEAEDSQRALPPPKQG